MSIRSGTYFVSAFAVIMVLALGAVSFGQSERYPRVYSYRVTYVTDRNQINYMVEQFRERIRGLDGNVDVVACGNAVVLTEEGFKDSSMGAVCTLKSGDNKANVLICDGGSTAGKFNFEESESLTRDDVVKFIKKNCAPDGK